MGSDQHSTAVNYSKEVVVFGKYELALLELIEVLENNKAWRSSLVHDDYPLLSTPPLYLNRLVPKSEYKHSNCETLDSIQ